MNKESNEQSKADSASEERHDGRRPCWDPIKDGGYKSTKEFNAAFDRRAKRRRAELGL